MPKAYRLPAHVRPTRYDIHLRARVGEPTFEGSVRIALRLDAAARAIDLHARDIAILSATVEHDGVPHTATGVETDAQRERVVVAFAHEIPAGEARLDLTFTGRVQPNMEGLYLSKDGAEECLATQCEETDARAIFPCFDEPAFKARFAWKVTTSPDATVLANGPLLSVANGKGERTWSFGATKPMSSYLVALTIGDVASTPERIVRNVPMRVWAMKGKEPIGAFGLDFAARLLPWFEDYFAHGYHFDKYDQVAVPSFSAGAMENAGLVIFRQSLLLRDPKTTSWQAEKLIARVISHEFAHQWFGNLVTMAWWDDIWLNESFAEWIAHKAVHAVAPDYLIWDDFHANKREAMSPDALASTHPIYTPVETPEQATELFDAVTYSKGSTLLRMIETFLGEEPFRAGLRTYMREFAERNARGSDLWRHLEASSGQPVPQLLESWILQPGFPVVAACVEGGALVVRQRRFFSSPTAPASDALWSIPLLIRYADTSGVHEARHLLRAREERVPLRVSGELRWLHVNADGIGYYRQDLAPELRAKLIAHAGELSVAEQKDLLDDTWALVRAGAQPITAYLDLLGPILRVARNQSVLAQAVDSLERVDELVRTSEDSRSLVRWRAWVAEALAGEATRLGYAARSGESRDTDAHARPIAAESRDDAERRAHVLRAMGGVAREPRAVAAARALADLEAEKPEAVDATLAAPAIAVAARVGDAARLEKHLALYTARRAAGAPPAQTQRVLTSLALFDDAALVERVLAKVHEGAFPLEAIGPVLRLMLGQPAAREPAWRHMKRDWTTLRERLGDMWTGFLVEHTGQLPGRLRSDVVAFYDANLHGVAQQAYQRALEALDQRAEFEARTRKELLAWVAAR